MKQKFQPGYKDFQGDIERYLKSIGKCEKTKDGMTVFRGYDDALKLMFQNYLKRKAFDPLVTHFRNWNWEAAYNDFLLKLTDSLIENGDWPHLQKLWEGVIAKRKKLYNDIRKIEKDYPGAVKTKTVTQSKERLLETLSRVKDFASKFGASEDVGKYSQMIDRVQNGRKV